MDGVSYFLTGFLRQGNAALARAYLGVGSGGGIPEAPIDGTFYGRENAAWVHAPTVSIPNADATHTGLLTAADWVTFNAKQPAGAYITDAPSDGQSYARNNGAWKTSFASAPIAVPASTATIPQFIGSVAHGLGVAPRFIRPVFVCTTSYADAYGNVFPIGAELDWGGWWDTSTLVWYKIWSDATNVYFNTEPAFTVVDLALTDFNGSQLAMWDGVNHFWAVVFYAFA